VKRNITRIKKKINKDTSEVILLEIEALLDGKRTCRTCPRNPICRYGSSDCLIEFTAKEKEMPLK